MCSTLLVTTPLSPTPPDDCQINEATRNQPQRISTRISTKKTIIHNPNVTKCPGRFTNRSSVGLHIPQTKSVPVVLMITKVPRATVSPFTASIIDKKQQYK